MDIKVITRHAPSNYGSLLQAIATQDVLRRMGHTCQIIDYVRGDEQGLKGVLTALKHKALWDNNVIKRVLYIMVRYPLDKLAELNFKRMRSHVLSLTSRCSTKEELETLKADVFMTGSDQVWGSTACGTFDSAYFLTFVKNGKKIAYAASFGETSFSDEIKREYKEMLKKYDAITVREDVAVEMLQCWGIGCSGQVLDPTLLLSGKDWDQYVSGMIEKKYVLVYQIHNDEVLNDYAKRFAKHVKMPLLRVSPSLHQIVRGGKLEYLPRIGRFLSLIKNCTFMVTDSFHGTAFALNYNRQFIEVLPNNKTTSRNLSLLRMTGLEDRIITNYQDFSIAQTPIDYPRVNGIIEKERKKSIQKLILMLAGV